MLIKYQAFFQHHWYLEKCSILPAQLNPFNYSTGVKAKEGKNFKCTKFDYKNISLLFHNYREMRLMCQEGNSTYIPSEKRLTKMAVTKMYPAIKRHAYRVNQNHTSTMANVSKRFLRSAFFWGGTIFSIALSFSTCIRKVWWNCKPIKYF